MPLELFFPFLASTLLLLVSFWLSKKKLGFYLLTSTFIYLSTFMWIPLNWLAGIALKQDMFPEGIVINWLWGAVAFYGIYVFISGLLVQTVKPTAFPIYDGNASGSLSFSCLSLFSLSILGYVALNGFSFSAGNYGHRLASNAGNGIFIIFFFLFIPVAYVFMLRMRNSIGLLLSISFCLFCGMLVYFTLGGSRNILAAGVVGVLVISQRLEVISMKSIMLMAVVLILLVNYLAFVRYGLSLDDNILALGFRFLIDSLSPYDSFNNIVSYFESSDEFFKGFEFIPAQFNPLIPRFLWPDKPVVPVTNAYFYTESILGITKGSYIISPTLLGGLYIMGGGIAVFIGSLCLSFFIFFLEKGLFSKSPFWVLFSYTLLPFTFFMVRESIELFISKSIMIFCTFLAAWICAVVINSMLHKITESRALSDTCVRPASG